ncbi:serine hydrolase domain-containing protein [Streptomyces sp. NPDC002491]
MTDHLHPGFEPVAELLQSYADADPTYSAQVCAIHQGAVVVDLVIGPRFTADSLICVCSTSKGVAGLALSTLVESGDLDLDALVSAYWPEFAAEGKAGVTVRTALSHRAGLLAPEGGFVLEEVLAHTPLAERLARTRPMWAPGTAHGYHAVSIGVIIGELVARITGTAFHDFWREVVKPLEADFHYGVAQADRGRVVPVLPPTGDQAPEPDALSIAGTAFGVGHMPPLVDQANDPRVIATGPVAFGGHSNARSLARLYAEALGGGLPRSRRSAR